MSISDGREQIVGVVFPGRLHWPAIRAKKSI
jgi:hypothetical protein